MTQKLLSVPYFSQLDNLNNPYGSCNVTSVAMCMAYFGIKGDGSGQLEDQLYEYLLDHRMSRHNPHDLAQLFPTKGLSDRFQSKATWAEVREHIDAGNPAIAHGYFTRFGHIVAIVGYDDTAYSGRGAWIVNDPYGEWFASGYRTDVSGERVAYSYQMMDQLCSPDGDLWIHFVSKGS